MNISVVKRASGGYTLQIGEGNEVMFSSALYLSDNASVVLYLPSGIAISPSIQAEYWTVNGVSGFTTGLSLCSALDAIGINNNILSQLMSVNRICSHGRITALPFSLASKSPFSIFIIPTVDSDTPIAINCKLYQDDAAALCPFNLKQWTEPAVVEIQAAAISLTDYTVYWGAGANVEES